MHSTRDTVAGLEREPVWTAATQVNRVIHLPIAHSRVPFFFVHYRKKLWTKLPKIITQILHKPYISSEHTICESVPLRIYIIMRQSYISGLDNRKGLKGRPDAGRLSGFQRCSMRAVGGATEWRQIWHSGGDRNADYADHLQTRLSLRCPTIGPNCCLWCKHGAPYGR